MNTTEIGDRSEACVAAALLKMNKVILRPWGNSQRYDLAIDTGDGKICRVQCKTARLSSDRGSLLFNTESNNGGRYPNKNYIGQVELFGIYSPDLDKVYLVPVEAVSRTSGTLRLSPAKNGQNKGVKMAEQFEVKYPPSSIG